MAFDYSRRAEGHTGLAGRCAPRTVQTALQWNVHKQLLVKLVGSFVQEYRRLNGVLP